jgi:superfamily II DNA/RNA helicase
MSGRDMVGIAQTGSGKTLAVSKLNLKKALLAKGDPFAMWEYRTPCNLF